MNTALFQTKPQAAPADSINEAGGKAYAMGNHAALAQYACTGCLNSTFYSTDEQQLARTLELCKGVDSMFVAKVAVYAREQGFMKDMPAVLLAYLSAQGAEGRTLVQQTFRRVVNSGRMLRGFVQVIRSGAAGRKSMGTAIKRLVSQWLLSRDLHDLLNDSVGNTPSVADLIKMVHPKPNATDQRAAFAYLIGKEHAGAELPPIFRQFEAFKKNAEGEVPDVHFNLLTALPLKTEQWATIARNGNWHFVRMNLNTFARHGVFAMPGMVDDIAVKLRDAEQIKRARVFPYQLLAAFLNIADEVPMPIKLALQDAMEVATANVPALGNRPVYVCPDSSGSMSSPITGHRTGATTKMTCSHIAGLVAASVLRNNLLASVLPFDTEVHRVTLNPRDSVMTNAQKLALNGGGTDCGAPLRHLNAQHVAKQNAVVLYISDNESWYRNQPYAGHYRGTSLAQEWLTFKSRNPGSKLICIDVKPSDSVQALDDKDVLNIGGFSDAVWPVIAAFAEGGNDPQHWVSVIDKIDLAAESR